LDEHVIQLNELDIPMANEQMISYMDDPMVNMDMHKENLKHKEHYHVHHHYHYFIPYNCK